MTLSLRLGLLPRPRHLVIWALCEFHFVPSSPNFQSSACSKGEPHCNPARHWHPLRLFAHIPDLELLAEAREPIKQVFIFVS